MIHGKAIYFKNISTLKSIKIGSVLQQVLYFRRSVRRFTTSTGFPAYSPGGMRRYHGRRSFETFSNMRSVMEKSILMDIHLRQSPYTAFKDRLLRLLMR
jgi:hypothetical protein